MNALINENELKVVKKYEFNTPLITNKDSIIEKCIKDYNSRYFQIYEFICEYNIDFKKD